MKCANEAVNAKRCTCTYPGCPRHGVCCDCIAYHRDMDELPGCLFTAADERTYDRSAAFFARKRR